MNCLLLFDGPLDGCDEQSWVYDSIVSEVADDVSCDVDVGDNSVQMICRTLSNFTLTSTCRNSTERQIADCLWRYPCVDSVDTASTNTALPPNPLNPLCGSSEQESRTMSSNGRRISIALAVLFCIFLLDFLCEKRCCCKNDGFDGTRRRKDDDEHDEAKDNDMSTEDESATRRIGIADIQIDSKAEEETRTSGDKCMKNDEDRVAQLRLHLQNIEGWYSSAYGKDNEIVARWSPIDATRAIKSAHFIEDNGDIEQPQMLENRSDHPSDTVLKGAEMDPSFDSQNMPHTA